jgi:hypothetical protein
MVIQLTTEYYCKEISISFWVWLNNFHVHPLCFKFLAPKKNPYVKLHHFNHFKLNHYKITTIEFVPNMFSLQPWLWKYFKSFIFYSHCICELFVNWIECRFCHQRLLVAAVYVWKLLICSKMLNTKSQNSMENFLWVGIFLESKSSKLLLGIWESQNKS